MHGRPGRPARHRPLAAPRLVLILALVLLAGGASGTLVLLAGGASGAGAVHPRTPLRTPGRSAGLRASAARDRPDRAAPAGGEHLPAPAGGAGWQGYWLVTRDGRVLARRAPQFGSVASATGGGTHVEATGLPSTRRVVALAPSADDQGYWEVTAGGTVTSFGDALFAGGARTTATSPADPVVGIAADDATGGFWLVTRDGRVIANEAPYYGALAPPAASALGHAATGRSWAATRPARRGALAVVALAPTADDHGYWEVTAGGTVTSFGDAVVTGTTSTATTADPVVGIAADDATGGFWLVTRDGQVLAHHAPFLGAVAPPRIGPVSPRRSGLPRRAGLGDRAGTQVSWRSAVVALAPTADDRGYWEGTAGGAVTGFGDAAGAAGGGTATAGGSTSRGATAGGAARTVRSIADAVVGVAADDWAPPRTSGAAGPAGVASPPPLAITTTALAPARQGSHYQVTIGASGGTATRQWAVASGWIPPGCALSPGGVLSGTPTAPGTYDFTVTVTDDLMLDGQAATAHLSLTVDPPVAPSSRWAGYTESGTGFSMVAGTFDVPDLAASTGAASTSEWVGIDGVTNGSLLQAGVQQSYDPATGQVSVYPWWEILPAPETRIPMTVRPGDRITVRIRAAGSGTWTIAMSDDSTGQEFSTTQVYGGPGTSADWIVEAPTSAGSGAIDPLGAFSPDVTFSSLDFTGASRSLTEWAIDQGGTAKAMPSLLTPVGFTVAQGRVAPPPP